MSSKCNACKNCQVEFSPVLHAWEECCNRARCKYEAKTDRGLNVVPRDREREKNLWLDE
jgi:hypothetical protein